MIEATCRSKVYEALCSVLAGEPGAVDWRAFDPPAWEAFLHQAGEDGAAPLTYWTFKECGWPESIPETVREGLAQAYYCSAAYNTLLYQELERLLAALESAAVRVIVLKGAVLAATAYPDCGLRPMQDLDLLVRKEDLERAVTAIQSVGYHLQKVTYHMMFKGGPQQGVTVELHWNLVTTREDLPGASMDWFWEGAQAWKASQRAGEETPDGSTGHALRLDPVGELLYLAAHLVLQHGKGQGRLIWYYDLDLLLRQHGDSLDWDEVRQQARRLGWGTALAEAARGTHERLGTRLPAGLLEALEVESGPAAEPDAQAVQGWIWGALQALDWKMRLQMGLRLFLPSPAYMRWRYRPRPGWLWPLCYPQRWLGMLGAAVQRGSAPAKAKRP